MSYYEVTSPPARFTLARAAQISSELQAIQDGFAKLPDESPLKRGRVWYAATVGGTANAITATMAHTMSAPYVAGDLVFFKPGADNTGAATLNVDGIGAVAIKQPDGSDVAAGNIQQDAVVLVAHNGTHWILVGAYVSTDQQTLAAIAADITTVAGISGNVTTVAGNSANVTTVAGISGNVTTVAGIAGNVSTVAGISADVTTVAARDADIATVAARDADIGAVADIDTAVGQVAAVDTEVTTVAGISGNVATVAGIAANVTIVAGNSANVTTVAGISSDVTTVATNVADVTNFADVYQGAKASNPSQRNDGSALQAGDLYFNTTSDEMRVRTAGGSWVAAPIGLTGTLTGNIDADGHDITDVGSFSAATALITALGANMSAGGFALTNVGSITQATGSTPIATLRQLNVEYGDRWGSVNGGTITTDRVISEGTVPIVRYTLGASFTITLGAPTSPYAYWKYFILTQDGVGGRDVTWAGPGGYTVQWPNGDEPDWASQDPATETIVIARVGFRANVVDLFVGD